MFDCNVFIHNDLHCFGRFFSLSVYFGVAKVTAKIVQMSEMKKKYAVFFFISECSLSYENIYKRGKQEGDEY